MKNKPIRTLKILAQHQFIKENDRLALEEVVNKFSLSVSPQMHQLIEANNPDDPIAMQFIPSIRENTMTPIDHPDPVGDNKYTVTKGIIHRYPDRCLLLPVHVCPVYCRFCFRKVKVGNSSATLSLKELEHALAYIENHPKIWEVILTGGRSEERRVGKEC